MIVSFACRRTERLFTTGKATVFLKAIEPVAKRKLTMLHMAEKLDDLRIPPGNRLEALKGKRKGQCSIHVTNPPGAEWEREANPKGLNTGKYLTNLQHRLCSRLNDGKPEGVEIVDYHD
jgi:toxin HigB-1